MLIFWRAEFRRCLDRHPELHADFGIPPFKPDKRVAAAEIFTVLERFHLNCEITISLSELTAEYDVFSAGFQAG